MFIETIPVGVFRCNCTVVSCERTAESIVIDPGDEPEQILQIIRSNGLKVLSVIHTHAHIDHVMGTFGVVEATGSTARLHGEDRTLWDRVGAVAASYHIPAPAMPPLGEPIKDADVIHFGTNQLRVIHTPGHTRGSCCFATLDSEGHGVVFSGDTLFRGKIGFGYGKKAHGGDLPTILASIRDRLLTLDEDTRVIPGHGPETRIGIERRTNPFLAGIEKQLLG